MHHLGCGQYSLKCDSELTRQGKSKGASSLRQEEAKNNLHCERQWKRNVKQQVECLVQNERIQLSLENYWKTLSSQP